MSNGSNNNQGQENVGRLLRRMTLANLGLDDLSEVDAESRDAMAETSRFAARIGRHVQRLDHVGAQIKVLDGAPEFMWNVQERYVPLHVDTDFIDPAIASDGPRNHTDVGAWRKIIDAVHLVLFDEEEYGDYVVSRGVSRRQVDRALTQMVSRVPTPTPSLFGPSVRARSLFGSSEHARSQRGSVAHQERTQGGAPAQRYGGHALSLDGIVERLDTRRLDGTPTPVRRPRTDFLTLSEAGRRELFGQPRTAGALRVNEAGREVVATSSWDDRPRGLGGLPAFASASHQRFAGRVADRAGDGRADARAGRRMMSGLRAVSPVQAGDFSNRVGAQIGYDVERRLDQHADKVGLGQDVEFFDPRVVPEAARPAHTGDRREGYRGYAGVSSGNLLAMVPESLEDAAIAGMHRRSGGRADTGSASYPRGVGSSVSSRGLGARAGGRGRSASQRQTQSTTMPPRSLTQAAAYSRPPSRSGRVLQVLADEPAARLGAAVQRAGGGFDRFDAELLAQEPSLPSTLGFTPADVMAALVGADSVRVASMAMTSPIGSAANVSNVPTVPGANALAGAGASASARLSTTLRRVFEGAMSGERVSASSRGGGEVVLGDVRVRPDTLRALTSSLRTVFSSLERTNNLASGGPSAGIDALASAQEESTFGRLDRMLALVSAGGEDSSALRQQLGALQRSGALRETRLAWMGDDPILLTTNDGEDRSSDGQTVAPMRSRRTAQSLRALVESGIAPRELAEAVRHGAVVLASSEVQRNLAVDRTGQGQRRSDILDSPADLSRMFGMNRVAQLLGPAVADAARPMIADMLKRSVEGAVRREVELQRALAHGETGRTVRRRMDVARSVKGDVSLVDTDMRAPRDVAGDRVDFTTSSVLAGGRMERSNKALRALASSAGTRVESSAGFGVAFDAERLAVTMQAAGPDARRRALEVSKAPRKALDATESAARRQDATRGIMTRSTAAPTLGVRLESAAPRTIGANADAAESFEPNVLGLARFEGRIGAELDAGEDGVRLLRLDEPARPIRIFTEPGENVRVSFAPEVLARMVANESRRQATLAGVTAEAVASGTLGERERREIAASVLGTERLEVFERITGGEATSTDVEEIRAALSRARTEAVPVRELRSALREALSKVGGSQAATIAREVESRIPGIEIGQSAARAAGLSTAYREVERALGRFEMSGASRAAREQAGYFDSLLPGAFDANTPVQVLADAFGAPLADAIRARLASVGSRGAADGDLTRLPIRDLRTVRAALDRGPEATAARTMRVRGAGPSTYEMVRPATLSSTLDRFARASTRAPGRQPQRADFFSRAGEPGTLGGTLETFVPAAAGARRSSLFTAQRAMSEPVLAASVGRRGEMPTETSGVSLSDAMLALQGADDDTLAELGTQVVDRMAERGGAVYFVESPAGMSDSEVREMFGLGSGHRASRRGERHDATAMLDRIDHFIGRARDVSSRARRYAGAGVDLSSVVKHVREQSAAPPTGGLPSWSETEQEQVKSAALGELREMLRSVGAVPIQGGTPASERALVDPSVRNDAPSAGQPAPLFSGGARSELMPSNQVRQREQAQRTSDTGKPSGADLEVFAKAVFDLLKEKLRDQIHRSRSQ